MHQTDHDRHLHQRPDHRSKSRTRIDAEHGDGNSYRQFKVITGCRIQGRIAAHTQEDCW